MRRVEHEARLSMKYPKLKISRHEDLVMSLCFATCFAVKGRMLLDQHNKTPRQQCGLSAASHCGDIPCVIFCLLVAVLESDFSGSEDLKAVPKVCKDVKASFFAKKTSLLEALPAFDATQIMPDRTLHSTLAKFKCCFLYETCYHPFLVMSSPIWRSRSYMMDPKTVLAQERGRHRSLFEQPWSD